MPINEQQIIEQYKKGQRFFDNLDLDDRLYDFKNAVLTGANFSKAFITADFSQADLRGANFSSSNVKSCDFREADLRGANFANASLDDANFSGAKLDEAEFEGATFYTKTFKKGEKPEN